MEQLSKIDHPSLGELSFCVLNINTSDSIISSISALLTSCANKLSESQGGHVPDFVVKNRILKYYTTEQSIKRLILETTKRFAIVRKATVIATALVATKSGVLTPEETHGIHSIDLSIKKHPIINLAHSVFNVAVDDQLRRNHLATILLNNICNRGQQFFNGRYLYIRSEPPDHIIWQNIGFTHNPELDEFFKETVPLPIGINTAVVYNSKYNCQCQKPALWNELFEVKKLKYYGFIKEISSND